MSRHRCVRVAAALALLFLVGCGRELTRDDAVAALQRTGADGVTATCMADTLSLLDELSAADSEVPSTEASRAALVRARERCTEYSAPDAETQATVAGVSVERPAASSVGEPPPPSAAIASYGGGAVADSVDDEAVRRLVALGRDEVTARCVVDHLGLLSAQYVFDSPTFGLGATPEEASAFALCS